jgi:CRP-like cAMP-binding protein
MTTLKSRRDGKFKSTIDPFVKELLRNIGIGKSEVQLEKDALVFSQDDPADAIFFIQTGKVKLTVVSSAGKEAVLGIFGPRACLGEACLAGKALRMNTATAILATTLYRIEKRVMRKAIQAQLELSEKFTDCLLNRNIDLEEDLCDQLFNHSEKRLARVLLKLIHFSERGAQPAAIVPRVSHETLAEMVGTTRSRITHFMNKFRKLGLITYDAKIITVTPELLTDVVLKD